MEFLKTRKTTPQRNTSICAIIDRASGSPQLFAIPNKTELCVAECIFKVFLELSVLGDLLSDRGPEFVNLGAALVRAVQGQQGRDKRLPSSS